MFTLIKTATYAEHPQVIYGSSSLQSFPNPEKKVGSPTEDEQTSLRKLSLNFLGLVFVLLFPNQVIVWATFLDLLNPQPVDA